MFSFVVRSVKSHALFMNWLLFQHVTRTSTTMRWWPININWMLLRNICQKGRGKKYDIQIEQQLQLKLKFALCDELLSEPRFTVGYDTKTNAWFMCQRERRRNFIHAFFRAGASAIHTICEGRVRQFRIVKLQVRLVIMKIGQTGQWFIVISHNWIYYGSCQNVIWFH